MKPVAEEIESYLDLFRRDPMARLRMRAAIKFGAEYAVVRDEWSPDSLAAFAGWEAYEAHLREGKCQKCGVEEVDVLDERGRPREDGSVKFVQRSCWVCSTLARYNEGEDDEGVWWELDYRLPGEEMVEELGR